LRLCASFIVFYSFTVVMLSMGVINWW